LAGERTRAWKAIWGGVGSGIGIGFDDRARSSKQLGTEEPKGTKEIADGAGTTTFSYRTEKNIATLNQWAPKQWKTLPNGNTNTCTRTPGGNDANGVHGNDHVESGRHFAIRLDRPPTMQAEHRRAGDRYSDTYADLMNF